MQIIALLQHLVDNRQESIKNAILTLASGGGENGTKSLNIVIFTMFQNLPYVTA